MYTSRYVRKDQRRYIEINGHTGGCLACGYFGALSGRAHNAITCRACGVTQCEGLRDTCYVCLYGFVLSESRAGVCGYAGCGKPAVAKAPRVGRCCKDCLGRVKARRSGGATLLKVIAHSLETLDRDWTVWHPPVEG